MSIRAQQNFDTVECVVGSLPPGYVNGDGTWAVGTTQPVSSPHSFGSTTKGSLDTCVKTDISAATNMGRTIDQKLTSITTGSVPSIGILLQSDATSQNCYACLISDASSTSISLVVFKRISGTYTAVGSGATLTGLTVAIGDTIHFRGERIGTAINVYLSQNGSALPGTPSLTVTDASITATGFPGLVYAVGGLTTPSMGADNIVDDTGVQGTPMVAGTATGGSVTLTTANATATAPTGGVATYTYQWFRSTTTLTLGSAVSGQTTTTLADTGLTSGTNYFYTLKQLDANGDFVFTNQISLTTTAGAATNVTSTPSSASTAVGVSTNITVSHNGTSASDTITPSGTGLTFSPTSASISGTATTVFACTPTSVGAKTATFSSSLGLTAATSTITGTTGTPYDIVNATDNLTGQNIMVLVPNSFSTNPYNSANPTGVILYAHGAGEDQTGLTTDTLKAGCVTALANAGYIMAGTNAHGNNWGNQVSVDDYSALDEYVRANYNVSNVCIWSQSMGGLDGLLALAQNKVRGVVGWLGTYPVCNLANLYGLGTFTSQINTAFGITGSGNFTYAHQTRGSDPVLMTGLAFRNVPMRFYASSADTVVPKAQNTTQFQALIATSCRENVIVNTTGDHGDPSNFQPSDYVAFFGRCFATVVANSGIAGVAVGSVFPLVNQVLLGTPYGPTNNLVGTLPPGFVQPSTTRVVSATVKNSSGALVPNTTFKWAWFDENLPQSLNHPTDQGSTVSTDASSNLVLTVHSALIAGGIGSLVLSTTDGTTTTAAVDFYGPVQVS